MEHYAFFRSSFTGKVNFHNGKIGKKVIVQLILRSYLDVKLAALSCSLLNICEAAAAIEAIDGAVAIELASVLASMMSSVLMLCLAVSVL